MTRVLKRLRYQLGFILIALDNLTVPAGARSYCQYWKKCFAVSRSLEDSPVQNHYYLIGQDHRAIKRRTRPMLGFENFCRARMVSVGFEFMHVISRGRMKCDRRTHPPVADRLRNPATKVGLCVYRSISPSILKRQNRGILSKKTNNVWRKPNH